jgi:hypothetical protein
MNRTNQVIHGTYCDVEYRGIVKESFNEWGEKYHTISLFDPIIIFNRERSEITVREDSSFFLENNGE